MWVQLHLHQFIFTSFHSFPRNEDIFQMFWLIETFKVSRLVKNVSRFTMRRGKLLWRLSIFNGKTYQNFNYLDKRLRREHECDAIKSCSFTSSSSIALLWTAITHCAEMLRNFIICEARGEHVDITTKIAFCDFTISFESSSSLEWLIRHMISWLFSESMRIAPENF